MAVRQIPVSNIVYDQRFRVELDGDFYIFRVFWNGVDERWYTDIYTGEGTLVVAGLRIVLSQDFIKYFQYTPSLPPGKIRFYDTQLKNIEPTLETFATQVLMLYQDV
jgi:hypothetical protein